MTLETTEPLAVCVGQDVVRTFNAREQKFLHRPRGAGPVQQDGGAPQAVAAARRRICSATRCASTCPHFDGAGPARTTSMSKQLRKAYSRKALKALEAPAAGARARAEGGR